jgi:hypothetical protein
MNAIRKSSILPALALALIASAAPAMAGGPDDANAGGPGAVSGGGAVESDDQCRANIRPLRDAYRDAVNKNGAGSYTAHGFRGELDQAYADCCRAHASRWDWCDASGGVRTDRPDRYPYDPGW